MCMDISVILFWMAGIAVVLDFIIYLFSSRYRKYGGHIIGTMAYVILLSDLAFAVYQGECGTVTFRRMLVGTLVIGALFIIGYTVQAHRHVQLLQKHTGLKLLYNGLQDDYHYQCEENTRLSTKIDNLNENLQRYVIKEQAEMEKHNLRIIANEEFEETLGECETTLSETRQAFQLYAFLVNGYSCERGPKFEARLTGICGRICRRLPQDDIRVLLKIDSALTEEAGKFYDAT